MKKLFLILFLLGWSISKADVTAEKNFNICMDQMQQHGALRCVSNHSRTIVGPQTHRSENEYRIEYHFYCLWVDSNYKDFIGSCSIQKYTAKGPAPIFMSLLNPGQDLRKDPLCPKSGSVLNLNTKSAGEVISLSGIPFQLVYDSAMDSSRPANRSVELNMVYPSASKLEDIPNKILNISVNGQFYRSQNLGQTYRIHYNEPVDLNLFSQSPFIISSFLHFQVVASFTTPLSEEPATGFEIAAFDKKMAVYKPEVWGLGRWTLANHHYYDSENKIIHWGNSGTISADLPIKNFSGLGSVYMGTDETGSEIYFFDSLGRHIETRTSLMGIPIYRFKYLDDHKLDQIINRDNLITQILRDDFGNPTGIRAPFGQTTALTVNSYGRLSSVTDAVGSVHEFIYQDDGSGLLSQITYPNGLTTAFEYDSIGLFSKETKSNGAIQGLFTSLIENIQQIQFFKNNGTQETSSTFTDTLGIQQTTTKDASGGTVLMSKFTDTHQIKDLGIISIETTTTDDIRFGSLVKAPTRVLVTSRGLPSSNAAVDSKYTYAVNYLEGQGPFEIAELKTTESHPRINNGQTRLTTKVFNGLEKTLETSSSGINRQKLYFDNKERVTKIERTGMLTTNLSFNAYGQLTTVSQGSAQQSFTYNGQGSLVQVRDPKGNVTNYERNANGQVTEKKFPNGDRISFGYTPSGEVKEIRAPNGHVHRFAQSVLDQVISNLTPANNETTYDYDQFGRILLMRKPSGVQAKYSYKNGTDFIEKIETPNGNYLFK